MPEMKYKCEDRKKFERATATKSEFNLRQVVASGYGAASYYIRIRAKRYETTHWTRWMYQETRTLTWWEGMNLRALTKEECNCAGKT